MLTQILLNRKITGTVVVLGVVGLSYCAGYETNKHYGKQIEKAKEAVALELSDRLMPEAVVKRNMLFYKKELVTNPLKYKEHIVDITLFGLKEYPTDIFVKGVRYGLNYIGDNTNENVKEIKK